MAQQSEDFVEFTFATATEIEIRQRRSVCIFMH